LRWAISCAGEAEMMDIDVRFEMRCVEAALKWKRKMLVVEREELEDGDGRLFRERAHFLLSFELVYDPFESCEISLLTSLDQYTKKKANRMLQRPPNESGRSLLYASNAIIVQILVRSLDQRIYLWALQVVSTTRNPIPPSDSFPTPHSTRYYATLLSVALSSLSSSRSTSTGLPLPLARNLIRWRI
jgi:hypothetical protein